MKINCVALKGVNEHELSEFVAWCGDREFDLTFIEVMPMGDLGETDRLDQYLSLKEVRRILERDWTLTDIPYRTGGPARYTECVETGQRIGFITPLTHNFLRELQPGPADLHGYALHVPRSGRRGRPPFPPPGERVRRAGHRCHPGGDRPEAEGP